MASLQLTDVELPPDVYPLRQQAFYNTRQMHEKPSLVAHWLACAGSVKMMMMRCSPVVLPWAHIILLDACALVQLLQLSDTRTHMGHRFCGAPSPHSSSW
jgi:hypothetical protein